MLTFGACKTDLGLLTAAQVPATSPEFAYWINTATEELMERGDWSGTVVPIFVCVARGCVVWPRYVGQVRKINVCNHPVPIHNMWWNFILDEHHRHHRHWRGLCGGECRMLGQGRLPTFSTIAGPGRQVRLYIDAAADVGKTLTLFGVDDTNGQPLVTPNADGTFSDGIVLTGAFPFAATTQNIRRIDRVIKQPTQGRMRLFGWDTVNLVLEDLAIYDPSETLPDYVRYDLHIPGCAPTGTPAPVGGCPTPRGVAALVKLQFIPAVADTDLVLISNRGALKAYIQSLKFKEAGDAANGDKYEANAIRNLNKELKNDFPDQQIPVDFGELAGLRVGMQRMF